MTAFPASCASKRSPEASDAPCTTPCSTTDPASNGPTSKPWDLDAATANPGDYLTHHAPKWLQTAAESTLLTEDLDTHRDPRVGRTSGAVLHAACE